MNRLIVTIATIATNRLNRLLIGARKQTPPIRLPQRQNKHRLYAYRSVRTSIAQRTGYNDFEINIRQKESHLQSTLRAAKNLGLSIGETCRSVRETTLCSPEWTREKRIAETRKRRKCAYSSQKVYVMSESKDLRQLSKWAALENKGSYSLQ